MLEYKKLDPIIQWLRKRKLPKANDLAAIALTPLDDILSNIHPEDKTRDAWAIAIALRTLYIRAVLGENPQGFDEDLIISDEAKLRPVSYLFIGERLEGLESVIKEMAMTLTKGLEL
ncbi:hypothetical protein JXA80_02385 [bacterium]|nr:hypothetical protein [candidate division CSSED10-310 bacterium]